MSEPVHRPAVRIICLDASDRVLLLCWRDPTNGLIVWEPPGGGIDDGETPYQAACRELVEETGLDPAAIDPAFVDVERDAWWKGQHKVGPEQFFVARFPGESPDLKLDGQLDYEQEEFQGYAWLAVTDTATVDGDVEPPNLPEIVALLG